MATGIKTPWKALLAGAVLLWGCADLALESDRIPTEMVVGPAKDRILEGEPFQLEVTIRDQEGKVIRIPAWAPPAWTVSDPAVAEVRPDGMLEVMKTGRVNLTASAAGLSASTSYCISGDRGRLGLPMLYVTQAAQNVEHNAPVIAGRPALLRLFLSAPQPLDFAPEIRISTVTRDEEVVWEHTFVPDRPIPNTVDEQVLEGSFNIEIPGSALEPGVGLVVELDPDCKAPLTPGTRTRYPPTGSKDLRVEEVQLYRQIFVPTVWREQADPVMGRWLDGINPASDQMHLTRNLLPVADLEVEVYDTLRTNANLFGFQGWNQWINEIATIAIQDGRRGYYYGVIGTSPSPILGLGSFGDPWSVGVAEASTYTHEIGHSMDLRHAPCGGAGGPDPDYPYVQGSIGIWGYDFDNKVLYNPDEYKDVMTYCNPVWISDFYFDKATTHRTTGDGGVDTSGGTISPDLGGDARRLGYGPRRRAEAGSGVRAEGAGGASRGGRPLPGRGARRERGAEVLPLVYAESAGAWRRQLRLLRALRARVGHDAGPDGAHRAGGRVHGDPGRRTRDGRVDGPVHGSDPGLPPELGRRTDPGRGDRPRDGHQGDSGGRVAAVSGLACLIPGPPRTTAVDTVTTAVDMTWLDGAAK